MDHAKAAEPDSLVGQTLGLKTWIARRQMPVAIHDAPPGQRVRRLGKHRARSTCGVWPTCSRGNVTETDHLAFDQLFHRGSDLLLQRRWIVRR